MERPQCCIDRCLTKTRSIKVKDIIYYLFPTDNDWASKWEKKIKEFDPKYKRKPNDIVCSLHFAKSSMIAVSRQLVDHALPIYFPQKNTTEVQQPQSQQPSSSRQQMNGETTIEAVSTKCCIQTCPTKFDNSEPKMHGFKFPNAVEQRKKWINMIELYNNQIIEWNDSKRICALHFPRDSFIKEDELKTDARPLIFKDAIACRQREIAQQQARTANRRKQSPAPAPTPTSAPLKTQSVNVPQMLHNQNANNHSMTERQSAPVIARRLSLPYSQLPPLIPKPNMLKRPNANETNQNSNSNSNIPNKVRRVSVVNGTQPMVKVATAKPAQRPVPGLNKVYTMPNSQAVPSTSNKMYAMTSTKPNANTNANVSVLRKSMPPPNKVQMPIITRIESIPASRLTPTAKLTPAPKLTPATKLTPAPKLTPAAKLTPVAKITSVAKLTPAPSSTQTLKLTPTAKLIPAPHIASNAGQSTKPGPTHIARLPPTLKPAPRQQIQVQNKLPTKPQTHRESQSNAKFVTHSSGTLIQKTPVISMVHSGASVVKVTQMNSTVKKAPVAVSSQSAAQERRIPTVIVIDNDEYDMAEAIKTCENGASNATATTNGTPMIQYQVKDPAVFQYPKQLLDRIHKKKKENDELSAELARWRKLALKLKQQYRLMNATTSSETIEIS